MPFLFLDEEINTQVASLKLFDATKTRLSYRFTQYETVFDDSFETIPGLSKICYCMPKRNSRHTKSGLELL